MLQRLRKHRPGSRPATASTDPVVVDLRAALSPDRVRDDGAERALLGHDASVFDGGVSGPICFPTST
ncbi:MAG: hypothetical protein R2710_14355, partial [Acidimicrobiales bacterium]